MRVAGCPGRAADRPVVVAPGQDPWSIVEVRRAGRAAGSSGRRGGGPGPDGGNAGGAGSCDRVGSPAAVPRPPPPDGQFEPRRSYGGRRSSACGAGAAGSGAELQGLGAGGGAPDADEQSGPGGGGAAGGAGGVRGSRPCGAELGGVRCDRAGAPRAGERRDAPRAVGEAGGGFSDAHLGAAGAHRELEPGAALGDVGGLRRARASGAPHVRADDGGLLDLYRDAGDPARHVRDVRRGRASALRRDAQGPLGLDGGGGGGWAGRSRSRPR